MIREGFAGVVLALAFAAFTAAAAGAPAADPAPAGPSTEELDQRIRVLERQKEDADAKARESAAASASDKGFGIRSGDFEIRLRGLVQLDGRFYTGDPGAQGFKDTFLLRRAEPSFEGQLNKLIAFKIVGQLAPNSGNSASVVDVYADLRFHPAATVRVGRYKSPVGLENLESSGNLEFVERGLPNELVPGRDYGAQLQGAFCGTVVSYALGVSNGTADGRDAAASDVDNRKDLAGRVFVEPFRNIPGAFQGLGLGIAGSRGSRVPVAQTTSTGLNAAGTATQFNAAGDTANAQLPTYRSPGQQNFFSYITSANSAVSSAAAQAGVVQADGLVTRWSPQAYYYFRSLGLLGEYAVSQQHVTRGANAAALANKAWQGLASFVLTGEDASYAGVKPRHPLGGDGWGALELVARYAVLDVDDKAFASTLAASFADPSKSASKASDVGVGLNWYITPNAKLDLNFDRTRFVGGAGTVGAVTDRPAETAIFSRVQYSF